MKEEVEVKEETNQVEVAIPLMMMANHLIQIDASQTSFFSLVLSH